MNKVDHYSTLRYAAPVGENIGDQMSLALSTKTLFAKATLWRTKASAYVLRRNLLQNTRKVAASKKMHFFVFIASFLLPLVTQVGVNLVLDLKHLGSATKYRTFENESIAVQLDEGHTASIRRHKNVLHDQKILAIHIFLHFLDLPKFLGCVESSTQCRKAHPMPKTIFIGLACENGNRMKFAWEGIKQWRSTFSWESHGRNSMGIVLENFIKLQLSKRSCSIFLKKIIIC